MKTDIEIYQKIGQILSYIAPKKASKMLLTAKISPENDAGRLDFDYIDQQDHSHWLMPESGQIDSIIMDQVVDLRKRYIENNLNNGQPIWNTAHMSLDLTTDKFDIEFEFDEIFEHEGEEFQE